MNGCMLIQYICRLEPFARPRPSAGAGQVGAGSGNQAAGAAFGRGQHQVIFLNKNGRYRLCQFNSLL